ncbi:MAG: DMT family transporter [Actinomycetota bacterium]
MSRAHPARDLTFAALGAFAFGCTILCSRAVARHALPPSVALGIRFAVASLLLLLVLRWRRRPLLPPRGERAIALLVGLVLYSIEASFFFMALQRGTAAAVALIFYAYPAVVAVVEMLLGRTAPRLRIFVALGLAVSGSTVVAAGGGTVAISATGVVCVGVAIALFVAYVLVCDHFLSRSDALTVAAWTAIGASVGTFLSGAATGQLRLPSGPALAVLAANGVATATAFTCFFVALDRMGPTRTTIVMALEAVFGVVLTALFLGESIRPIVAFGGLAVLVGAAVAGLTTPTAVEVRETATPA